jgi:hypothetical protein
VARESFGGELRRAAELSDKFYGGSYAGALDGRSGWSSWPTRHRGRAGDPAALTRIAGDQGYIDLAAV